MILLLIITKDYVLHFYATGCRLVYTCFITNALHYDDVMSAMLSPGDSFSTILWDHPHLRSLSLTEKLLCDT